MAATSLSPYIKDLNGKSFGRWRVLSFAGTLGGDANKTKHAYWNCVCECGAAQAVRGTKLAKGLSVQCSACNLGKSKSSRASTWDAKRSSNVPGEAAFRTILMNYIKNANHKGIPFELEDAHVHSLLSGNCHYCGIGPSALRVSRNGLDTMMHNGIDRVDNSLGYSRDNVVTCCRTCNFAKRDMSTDEFLSWVFRIYRHSVVKS
jgi:hypothetical protein